MEKISVKIEDKEILVNFWKTNKENLKGIFYIHHGMAEHIERYDYVAKKLNNHGYSVAGYDQLGHGCNQEEGKGIFAKSDGWNKVIKEATAVSNHFYNLYPSSPSYLLGHSMGSFISMNVANNIKNLKGIFLTGTYLPTKIEIYLLKFLLGFERLFSSRNNVSRVHKINFQRLNSFFRNPRTQFDWLAKDKDVVDAYIADNNCGFDCTNSLWCDFIAGNENIMAFEDLKKLNKEIRIYLAAGKDDPCIQTGSGIKGLFEAFNDSFENVYLDLYDGMRHEILNEHCKDELLESFIKFIKE